MTFRAVTLAAAAMTFLIAGSAVVAYIAHSNFGPERLFPYGWTETSTMYRGRMSPQTAGALMCLSVALALQVIDPPRRRVAQVLGIVAATLSLLALASHIFGVAVLFGATSILRVALPTAVALLASAGGIAEIDPDFGIRSLLSRKGPAGRYARRLALTVLVLPFGSALLLRGGEVLGWYDENFRSAAYVAGVVLLLSAVVWRATISLYREEDEHEKLLAERSARETAETLARELREQIIQRSWAEGALRTAQERLNAHLDNSPLAIVEFDPQLRVTRWSRQAEQLFGWTASEIVGRAVHEIRWVYDKDLESVAREAAGLRSGARPRSLSVNRNYCKDDRVIHCEWYNSAIYDSEGGLISILSQVLDVTERKRCEAALCESEQRFRAVQENSPDGFVMFRSVRDESGKIIDFAWAYMNEPAERVAGVSPGALLGRRLLELYPGIKTEGLFEAYVRVVETGTPLTREVRYQHDGLDTFVRLVATRVEDGLAVSFIDLSDRMRAGEALRQSE